MKLSLLLFVCVLGFGLNKKQDAAADLVENQKFYDKTLLNLKTLEQFIANLLYTSKILLDNSKDLRKMKETKQYEDFVENLKETESLRDSVQGNIKNQVDKIKQKYPEDVQFQEIVKNVIFQFKLTNVGDQILVQKYSLKYLNEILNQRLDALDKNVPKVLHSFFENIREYPL